MKYAVEMGSSFMMYIPSCMKIISDILKLVGGRGIHIIYIYAHTARCSHKPAFIFSK
jgi:hypothetical protein